MAAFLLFVEAVLDHRGEGRQRHLRIRPPHFDLQHTAPRGTQSHEFEHTASIDRPPVPTHQHVGIEPAQRADEDRGRARV